MTDELPTRTDLDADTSTSREAWPPCPWNPPDLPKVLIGREQELEALSRVFEDVITDWSPQVHLVVGELGLGKTRLLREFCLLAREREPTAALFRITCPTQGGRYRLWDAVVRACLKLSPREPAEQTALQVKAEAQVYLREEQAALLAQLVLENEEAPRRSPIEEQVMLTRWSATLIQLLEALAFESPLVLALDDIDQASGEDFALLSSVATAAKGRPFMVLLGGSTYLLNHLPGWERIPHTRLWPLNETDSERLARLYLTGLPGEVQTTLLPWVLAQTLGNPQVLRELLELCHASYPCVVLQEDEWVVDVSPLEDLNAQNALSEVLLPASLQALPDLARQVLAQGACMGREFYLGALSAVALSERDPLQWESVSARSQVREQLDEALSHLVEARFIESRATPLKGEDCFAFRTPHHQALALRSVPRSLAQRWRSLTLEWLEQQLEGLEDDMLSSTYLRDLAVLAEGVGQLRTAAQYALKAGRVALKGSHLRLALGFFEEALRLAPLSEVALRLRGHMALGELHLQMGANEEALRHLHQALQRALGLVDRRSIARLCRQIANLEVARGEYVIAQQSLLEAIEASRQLDDAGGMARGDLALGHIYRTLGELSLAHEAYERARDYFGWQSDPRGLAEVHQAEGALAYERGDWDMALERLEASLWEWRSLGDLRGEVGSLNNLGALMLTRNPERSLALWSEAYTLACELGDASLKAILSDNLGEAYLRLGRYEEAEETLQRARELASLTQRQSTLIDALRNLCLVAIARADFEQATHYLEQAEWEAKASQFSRLNATLLHLRGELAFAQAESFERMELEEGAPLPLALIFFERAAKALTDQGYLLAAADSWERFAQASTLAGAPLRAQEALEHAAGLRSQGASPPPLPIT